MTNEKQQTVSRGERYSVPVTTHRRRIQAIGAAISRRDWNAVERAHADIRDAFDRPEIYDPPTALSAAPAHPQDAAPALGEEAGGEFARWTTADLAGQCRMQSREMLDPELSRFLVAVADRLRSLSPTQVAPVDGGGAQAAGRPSDDLLLTALGKADREAQNAANLADKLIAQTTGWALRAAYLSTTPASAGDGDPRAVVSPVFEVTTALQAARVSLEEAARRAKVPDRALAHLRVAQRCADAADRVAALDRPAPQALAASAGGVGVSEFQQRYAERLHERATGCRWTALLPGGDAHSPGTQFYWLNLAGIASQEFKALAPTAKPEPDSGELPDTIRVPLHESQADADYLFGRAAADGACAGVMAASVKARLKALEDAILADRPVAEGVAGWRLVPEEATRGWASRMADLRQGRSSTPRCEAPSQRDVSWATDRIREVLEAAPSPATTPAAPIEGV